MKTAEMIDTGKLWGGMDIGSDYKDSDVVVFGIPYDKNVSYRPGAADAPAAIRETTFPIPPTTEYFEDISALKVSDIGDIEGSSCEEVFGKVRKQVADLVREDKFFTMIGGDHSVTIPVLEGINDAVSEEFGIIHIDAHFDLCDELSGSKVSHGCTQRRAVELEHVSGSESIYFLAIRSGEQDELEFMRNNKVNVISAADLDHRGVADTIDEVKKTMGRFKKIYLTVDIDCLDPGYAAGTGTPKFGGITPRQLLDLLRGLFDLPIMAFDLVEVAPSLDQSMTSVYAGQRVITECWGHWFRKNK